MLFLKLVFVMPVLIVLVQMYNFAVARKGVEKQKTCRALGIACTTVGIVCLIFRTVSSSFAGLLLIMMGLRLISHGLDRLNKTVFIDRYHEDSQPAAESALVTVSPASSAAPVQSEAMQRQSTDATAAKAPICPVPESTPS